MADTTIVIAEAVRSAVGRALKGSLAQKRPDDADVKTLESYVESRAKK